MSLARRTFQSLIVPLVRNAALAPAAQVMGSTNQSLRCISVKACSSPFTYKAIPNLPFDGFDARIHWSKGDAAGRRRIAKVAEDPWIESHTPEPPVDAEHVSITNELEKEISKATSVEAILDLVAKFKDDFQGPNIASALVAIDHLAGHLPAPERSERVNQQPLFKALLGLIEEQHTFDTFTLMQVLERLGNLDVHDERLRDATTARMKKLVTTMDARHLLKLLKQAGKVQYTPTDDVMAVLARRAEEIKEDSHPETREDIARMFKKLSDTNRSRDAASKP